MLLNARALLVGLILVACGVPDPVDAGVDAGRDAGGDAGYDAGRDAGYDAGVDAGHDGGPRDPGWEPWLTLSEECSIERARYPERLWETRWGPCPEQPVGCLRAVSGGGVAGGGYFDEERGRGYYYQAFWESDDRGPLIHALSPTEGPVLAAWRTPPIRPLVADNMFCSVFLGLGAGYAVLVAEFTDFSDRNRDAEPVYRASLEEIGTVTERLATIPPPSHAVDEAKVSADLVVFNGTYAIDNDGRQRVLRPPLVGVAEQIDVVGRDVWWESWADRVRIAHGDMDSGGSIFYGVAPGDIKGFHTDGIEFAWLEGYDLQPDRRYARLHLWAAPYTTDPAALAPRMIREIDERGPTEYGGGWYVMPREDDPERIEIISTADGSMRQFIPRGGVNYEPMYVTEREILVLAPGMIRLDPTLMPVVAE